MSNINSPRDFYLAITEAKNLEYFDPCNRQQTFGGDNDN